MIHRFWMGPPRSGPDYRPSIMRVHKQLVLDWTPETLPVDLRALCTIVDDPRRTSNLIRYALLFNFGGLWLDHDVESLQCLTLSKVPWTAALGRHREGCALWFPTLGHPMMRQALDRTLQNPSVVGAKVLNDIGRIHQESVRYEHRVLPYDSLGRVRSKIEDALAIHHWESSSKMQ